MSRHARMQWTLVVLLAAVSTTACSENMPAPFWKKDRTPHAGADAPFDPPNTYHEWAYDSPSYMKPAQELTPEAKVKAGDPLHYFTKDKVVMIRRPEGYTPEETPRVGIWWTDNNGFHWNKAGYFGRGQSFFAFEASDDGDYGIRFVGPGQEPALHSLPLPERVYHVDTALPEVAVVVEPEQSWYHVGDTVTIAWTAEDYHLIEYPVRVGLLTDFTGDDQQAVELQRDLANEGSITYTIDQNSLDHEIRFRVDALDRAGNLGIAISFALQVVAETPEAELGDEQIYNDETMSSGDGPPPDRTSPAEPPSSPTLMNENTHSSAIRPRTNSAPTRIEPMVPFATAAARASELAPEVAEPQTPTYADNTGAMPEPTGSAFTLPESLTGVPGTHVTSNEVASSPIANPDGDGYGQSDDVPPMQPLDAPASDNSDRQLSGHADEPSASLLPQQPLADLMAQTRPSELLIPMPATVEQTGNATQLASAHPWRTLSGSWPTVLQTVWSLPRPNFSHQLNRLFDIGALADSALARPVAEPPASDHAFAGLPEDAPGTITP